MSKNKFFILVCMVVSAVLCMYGPAGIAQADMPTEGLVSYWAFDEGEGSTAYDSAGTKNGSIYEAQWTEGFIGTALRFDGSDDYVEVGPQALPMGDKSFFAWIKMPPVGQGSGSEHDYFIYWGASQLRFNNGVELRARNIWSGGYDAGYVIALDDDQWHHAGFTYDNDTSTLHLYFDGIEVASSVGNDQHLLPTYIECIGGHWSDELNRSWKGKIDEVTIYNKALSVEEAEQLYQAGLGQLAELEIAGPSEVAENFHAGYKAIAHYDNGRTEDVTGSTGWAVDDEQTATINDNGLLQTEPVPLPRDITIYAEYTEDDIAVAAEKIVSVVPICPAGSALEFDGSNDAVEVGPQALPMGDKSFFAWVKMPPVGQGSSSEHDYFIYWGASQLRFNNGVELRAKNIWSGGYDASYAVALDDDQWHHAGFTYDNDTSTLHLYFDGIEVATSVGNDQHLIPDTACIGGHVNEPLNRSWKGRIDEVCIYDRALSQEEVWEIMHAKPTGAEPGLVAYWNFDEGAGQTAHDLFGGHDGYLGSDWENPDDRDPVWVESDAPVGICPVKALLERNISNAVEIKQNVLEQLDEALASERAAEDILRDMQRNGDTTELSPIQIIRARIKVVWAIIKETWSKRKIGQSKEHLEDSLEIVTQEADLNPAGRPRRSRRPR